MQAASDSVEIILERKYNVPKMFLENIMFWPVVFIYLFIYLLERQMTIFLQ